MCITVHPEVLTRVRSFARRVWKVDVRVGLRGVGSWAASGRVGAGLSVAGRRKNAAAAHRPFGGGEG